MVPDAGNGISVTIGHADYHRTIPTTPIFPPIPLSNKATCSI